MRLTDGRSRVSGVRRSGFRRTRLLTLVAVIALAAIPVASAKEKSRSVTVDSTMTLAIIGQTKSTYHFVARLTGKPFGTAAAVGQTVITNTPNGLISKGRPVMIYAKKGTLNLKTKDVVDFQPDGSISFNGTFKVLRGTGKYKGATGGGTLNSALPPGSNLNVGAVVPFDVHGKVRY